MKRKPREVGGGKKGDEKRCFLASKDLNASKSMTFHVCPLPGPALASVAGTLPHSI